MPVRLNKWIRAFFSLNKSEQRGIVVLVVLILLIAIFNILLPFFVNNNNESDLNKYKADIDSFLNDQQPLIDSVRIEYLQNSGEMDMAIASHKIKPTKFNPNKLPVEAWKEMGFTEQQIKTIKNYEAKGGKFRRKEDLKNIYSISDVEYEIIEPFIDIPSQYKSDPGKVKKTKPSVIKIIYHETKINSANANDLMSNLGLSKWLAKRTISYRNILGGFITNEQLKEVYGLNDSIFNLIDQYIDIDTGLITKIDVNNVQFQELLKHPYFDYNTTKSFFNVRNKVGSFSSINELKQIEGLNDTTLNKVWYYLYIRPLEK